MLSLYDTQAEEKKWIINRVQAEHVYSFNVLRVFEGLPCGLFSYRLGLGKVFFKGCKGNDILCSLGIRASALGLYLIALLPFLNDHFPLFLQSSKCKTLKLDSSFCYSPYIQNMSPFAEVSIVSMSFKSVFSFSFLTVITVNLVS